MTDFDLFWGTLPAAAPMATPAAAPLNMPRPTANAEAAFALLSSGKPMSVVDAMLLAQAAMATA